MSRYATVHNCGVWWREGVESKSFSRPCRESWKFQLYLQDLWDKLKRRLNEKGRMKIVMDVTRFVRFFKKSQFLSTMWSFLAEWMRLWLRGEIFVEDPNWGLMCRNRFVWWGCKDEKEGTSTFGQAFTPTEGCTGGMEVVKEMMQIFVKWLPEYSGHRSPSDEKYRDYYLLKWVEFRICRFDHVRWWRFVFANR